MGALKLEPDSRVRVTAPPIRHAMGRIDHWTPDSLVIQRDPPNLASVSPMASFHRSTITHLEASRGFKGHAVTGAVLGFLVGTVAGFFVAESVVGEGADPFGTEFDEEALVGVWAGTIVATTVLGGFVGGSAKFERWKEIDGF